MSLRAESNYQAAISEKLTVAQLIKFPIFYGSLSFIKCLQTLATWPYTEPVESNAQRTKVPDPVQCFSEGLVTRCPSLCWRIMSCGVDKSGRVAKEVLQARKNEFWFENVMGIRHFGCGQVNNIEMDIWENRESRRETDY